MFQLNQLAANIILLGMAIFMGYMIGVARSERRHVEVIDQMFLNIENYKCRGPYPSWARKPFKRGAI